MIKKFDVTYKIKNFVVIWTATAKNPNELLFDGENSYTNSFPVDKPNDTKHIEKIIFSTIDNLINAVQISDTFVGEFEDTDKPKKSKKSQITTGIK